MEIKVTVFVVVQHTSWDDNDESRLIDTEQRLAKFTVLGQRFAARSRSLSMSGVSPVMLLLTV